MYRNNNQLQKLFSITSIMGYSLLHIRYYKGGCWPTPLGGSNKKSLQKACRSLAKVERASKELTKAQKCLKLASLQKLVKAYKLNIAKSHKTYKSV